MSALSITAYVSITVQTPQDHMSVPVTPAIYFPTTYMHVLVSNSTNIPSYVIDRFWYLNLGQKVTSFHS